MRSSSQKLISSNVLIFWPKIINDQGFKLLLSKFWLDNKNFWHHDNIFPNVRNFLVIKVKFHLNYVPSIKRGIEIPLIVRKRQQYDEYSNKTLSSIFYCDDYFQSKIKHLKTTYNVLLGYAFHCITYICQWILFKMRT